MTTGAECEVWGHVVDGRQLSERLGAFEETITAVLVAKPALKD
jgi:hypothetical protein